MTEPIIYVVDDDEAMRDSMTWLLEGEGYQVACFESAEAFLRARNDAMRGCIVLDVRMPEMSGLELHEKLTTKTCSQGFPGHWNWTTSLPPASSAPVPFRTVWTNSPSASAK